MHIQRMRMDTIQRMRMDTIQRMRMDTIQRMRRVTSSTRWCSPLQKVLLHIGAAASGRSSRTFATASVLLYWFSVFVLQPDHSTYSSVCFKKCERNWQPEREQVMLPWTDSQCDFQKENIEKTRDSVMTCMLSEVAAWL
jgi:hypothetical protein